MATDIGPEIASQVATAHERTNIEDAGPHNESVMDQMNNAEGVRIGAGLPANPTREQVQDAVRAALDAGRLRCLDNIGNDNESGLIQPTHTMRGDM